ncbi:unnamed protein product [Rotaria sp. Silwood1]|nr:unnamed protein product [Rotaria sp. Silwood1]CAF4781902.1 unnamed protein product [Rotaria sp. Silwood1]
MNNPLEALRYFNERLSIYNVNYGSEHENVKMVEKDITQLNDEQQSSSTNEIEKENMENKSCFDHHDPPSSDSTPSSIDFAPRSKSDYVNIKKLINIC